MQLTEQSKPWHKHPLVWMMIAIPFSAIVMGVIMIWLAVDTDDGLVADDYYKQGLEINRDISRDKRSTELGLHAVINFDNTARLFTLELEKGKLPEYPKSLQLHLQHATRANSDIYVSLNHGMTNQYIGNLKQSISEGVWYFEITDADWKLNARSHIHAKNIIQLHSGY